MKQVPLILSALSLVGVLVLFGMKMNEPKSGKKPVLLQAKDSSGNPVSMNGMRVAYVDIDTLESQYTYFKAKKEEFELRQKQIDAELEKMANALQNDYVALQKKAQAGQMTESEGEAAQQSLMKRQQEIEMKRQNLGTKYLKDQEDFNKELHDDLYSYIEEYNADKGYDYILSYSKDGSILYANDAYNITDDIISGMNERKKAPKK
ncbi:MAG: OmpH family outer membrane protein [Chitinophagaceae bacterium]|nr:OmpH family outer membrane protein [Chitinophagaceae bacterium]